MNAQQTSDIPFNPNQAGAPAASQDPIATVQDDDLNSLLDGTYSSKPEAKPDPETGEEGKPDAGEPTKPEAITREELEGIKTTMNQLAGAVLVSLQRGAQPAAGAPSEPEDLAKAALQKEYPTLDKESIDFLYRSNKVMLDAATRPLVDRIQRLEGVTVQREQKDTASTFDKQLDALLDKEGITKPTERRLVRGTAIAEGLMADGEKFNIHSARRVILDVKSRLTEERIASDDDRRESLKADEGKPAPAGRSGRVGFENLQKKAVGTTDKRFNFGGAGSVRMATEILKRATLTD